MDSSFGKMPTTSARRLTSLSSRSSGSRRMQLGSMLRGEGHVGERDVMPLASSINLPSFSNRGRS